MTDRNGHFRRLTAPEALRALYVDFEGEKDRSPVLLGVHRRGRGARPSVHHDVLGDGFSLAGEPTTSLHEAIERLVRRAEHGDRRIVSWTEYDLTVVRRLRDEDPGLVERFERRFANAKRFAEVWRNTLHDGRKPESGRLADYLALIEYPLPQEAKGGDVGPTVRGIRKRLERGLEPTPGQRDRWALVIEHNRHDCVGMRRVCIAATRELEAARA
jgi:hypothetical protein